MNQSTTETTAHTPRPSTLSRMVVPALWLGAGVLLGIALFRGDESIAQNSVIQGLASRAHAGMVSHSGTFAMMTNESGNEDLVVVLDQRSESLLVYRGDTQKGIELQQRLGLARAFEDARLRTIGQ